MPARDLVSIEILHFFRHPRENRSCKKMTDHITNARKKITQCTLLCSTISPCATKRKISLKNVSFTCIFEVQLL
jgi:hypothetical protein